MTQKPTTFDETPDNDKARPEAGTAARQAAEIASDKQAADIVLLDVRGVSGFTDYMIILSASSTRQLTAVANDLTEAIEENGLRLHHREGAGESGWVLLDFADLVIHIFSPGQRSYYGLEKVWSKGKTLLHIQ